MGVIRAKTISPRILPTRENTLESKDYGVSVFCPNRLNPIDFCQEAFILSVQADMGVIRVKTISPRILPTRENTLESKDYGVSDV